MGAVAVAQTDRTAINMTYVNSLNQTIDLEEERVAAWRTASPLPSGF